MTGYRRPSDRPRQARPDQAASSGQGPARSRAVPRGDAAAARGGRGRSAAAQAHRGPARRRRRVSWWVELIVLFALALVIMLVIKTYVMQAFFIPSSSMENTLDIGDKVLVNKLIYHFRSIDRGDIVVFNGEGSWDPPRPPGPATRSSGWPASSATRSSACSASRPGVHDYIKRVIGLPGDHVACCDAQGQVTVNGVALNEKSYLYPGNPPSMTRFSIVVPPGPAVGDGRPPQRVLRLARARSATRAAARSRRTRWSAGRS